MKYRLEGLDCAQCAVRIESELKKVSGLEGATVNFATQTVVLDPKYEGTASDLIRAIEPDVRLVPGKTPAEGTDGDAGRRNAELLNILRIVGSGLLLAAGIFWNDGLHATPFSAGEWAVLLPAYFLAGWPVLRSAFLSVIRGKMFNEMFLMTIATAGALVIHEVPEAVAVMLFYAIGEHMQDLAVHRSRKSITSLMNLRPDSARVLENGEFRTVSPEDVEVGAVVEVLPGEKIPLDGIVQDGGSTVNTVALTGESVPREVLPGDEVLAGFVNEHGRLRIGVTKEFGRSSVARILELVSDASNRKSATENFITKFAGIYTPIIVFAAAVLAFLPPLVLPGASLTDWVYRALVLLVISCPCALVVSIPLGYFGGIGGASRNSILVKGANFLDELGSVSTVVFDKTGTLTKGVFRITDVVPRNGYTRDDLLTYAAVAESQSSHPVARVIREAVRVPKEKLRLEEYVENRGFGVKVRSGNVVIHAGNDRFFHREGIPHGDCDIRGTVVYVAVDGVFAGYIVIADEIKDHAKETIKELKDLGVRRVLMLTGDNAHIAEGISRELDLDGYFPELLPEEKVAKLEELEIASGKHEKIAFVGDGMNDAPVLMRSDIGIAMGGLGSDAAIEAADIVLMDDHLSRIPLAFRISRFTRKIVLQNIALALSVKGIFIVLSVFGAADMWEAVIGDVGVSILAVLNSVRTLRFAARPTGESGYGR